MKRIWKYGILCLALLIIMGTTAEAKSTEWDSWGTQWYKDGYVFYITDNALYRSPNQPHSMGIRDKIASWTLKDDERVYIKHGYKNKIYVELCSEFGGQAVLYSVNIKNNKKTKEISKCNVTDAKGNYIYGTKTKINDNGAYPVYLWKITDKSAKQVKKIGNHISRTTIVKNKVYYASYPNSKMKKMTVYCCNLDGSHRKKLFTLTGTGDLCTVEIRSVTEKTITAYVSSGDKAGEYVYTFKTGKLKKK